RPDARGHAHDPPPAGRAEAVLRGAGRGQAPRRGPRAARADLRGGPGDGAAHPPGRHAVPGRGGRPPLNDPTFRTYLETVHGYLERILAEEAGAIRAAADLLADQVAADRLIHVFGPGGHSNLAAQEVFFRAGGLMHISAILDEGTLLSNGALRSMAIERTPGYGRVVIEDRGLGEGDLLVLVNAYGINSALIDAALTARERGARLIGISSRRHAAETAPDHPARHP